MKTVYEKLMLMAKEEAQGRGKVSLKELCNGISKRFRLNHKEIYVALKEMQGKSSFNLHRNVFEFQRR